MENRGRFSFGLTSLLCCISLIISVATLAVCIGMRANIPAAAENFSVPSDTVKNEKPVSPIYYVGINGEKIVVSTPDGDVIRELGARADFLPESEREMLRHGIAVYSDEQLYLIEENYMD